MFPAHALRYLPDTPAASPLPDASFAAGEALEHQQQDYAAAAQWFRQLANGSSDGVRAGALIRLARNEIKRKHPARALAAYDELGAMASTSVNGEPAALVARHARLPLLDGPTRASEAATLLRDLESARWPISRTTYDYYRSELAALAPADAALPIWEEAAAAIAAISQRAGIESGAQVIWVNGAHPLLLVWRAQHGDAAAVALRDATSLTRGSQPSPVSPTASRPRTGAC